MSQKNQCPKAHDAIDAATNILSSNDCQPLCTAEGVYIRCTRVYRLSSEFCQVPAKHERALEPFLVDCCAIRTDRYINTIKGSNSFVVCTWKQWHKYLLPFILAPFCCRLFRERLCTKSSLRISGLFPFLLFFSLSQDIMTNSPPDLSSLSLSSQQRLHDSYDYEGPSGNRPQYHFATSPGIPIQSQYNPLTTGQSPLKKPVRSGLPTVCPFFPLFSLILIDIFKQWLDNSSDSRSLSPQNNSDFSSAGGSPPMSHLNPPIAPTTPSLNPDDEIIPTAIVIKNIPFNVKRETLLDIIVR